MKFKDFYNPRHVYEGFFEAWFIRPFIHRYADFRGTETPRDAFRSFLAWIIVSMGVAGVMMGQIGIAGPEAGKTAAVAVCTAWGVLSLVPLAAICVRLTHRPSATEARTATVKPRLLGVDTLLGVSCLLFFVTGLLMMTTTLASGTLHPNARYTGEPDTPLFNEDDCVKDEPIFTYQDEPAPQSAPDTLSDLSEPDILPPEQTYDPSIDTDAPEPAPREHRDTL